MWSYTPPSFLYVVFLMFFCWPFFIRLFLYENVYTSFLVCYLLTPYYPSFFLCDSFYMFFSVWYSIDASFFIRLFSFTEISIRCFQYITLLTLLCPFFLLLVFLAIDFDVFSSIGMSITFWEINKSYPLFMVIIFLF